MVSDAGRVHADGNAASAFRLSPFRAQRGVSIGPLSCVSGCLRSSWVIGGGSVHPDLTGRGQALGNRGGRDGRLGRLELEGLIRAC
jgi:hypothetical protein